MKIKSFNCSTFRTELEFFKKHFFFLLVSSNLFKIRGIRETSVLLPAFISKNYPTTFPGIQLQPFCHSGVKYIPNSWRHAKNIELIPNKSLNNQVSITPVMEIQSQQTLVTTRHLYYNLSHVIEFLLVMSWIEFMTSRHLFDNILEKPTLLTPSKQ